MNNNIKNKIVELYNNTPDYVTVVSYGYKTSKNKKTDKECIIFGVKKKKKISEIPINEILPRKINLGDGQSILTDVIEIPEFLTNICYNYEPIVGDPTDSQIAPNRRKQRPIKGGLSTTNLTRNEQLGIYSAGTLGAIVVDSIDCRMVGLTNNHVYASNPFVASDRSIEQPIENTYQNITSQPADLDGGEINLDEIGKVKRYFPLSVNEANYVDAAITTLDTIDVDSYKVYGLAEPYTYLDFATTEEIDNILNYNSPIFKAGRTTGSVGFPFSINNDFCIIKITQTHASATVGGYFNNGVSNSVDFQDCLIFTYSDDQPGVSIPGDSGSVLIARFGDVYKIVGLCFAGSPFNDPLNPSVDGIMGIASRIDKVAELLDVQPWTPDKKIKLNSENPACYVVKSGLSSEKFIYLNGKKYYQIGTTYQSPTDTSCLSTTTPEKFDKCYVPTPTPTPTSNIQNCDNCTNNLILNGDFEQGIPGSFGGGGTVTYWTQSNIDVHSLSYAFPSEPLKRWVDLNQCSPGYIQQTISTIVGQLYEITFNLASNNYNQKDVIKTCRLSVIGSSTLTQDYSFDPSSTTYATYESMGWVKKTFTFTADSSTTIIKFESTCSGCFGPAIDCVCVQQQIPPTPTPTPILTGFYYLEKSGSTCWGVPDSLGFVHDENAHICIINQTSSHFSCNGLGLIGINLSKSSIENYVTYNGNNFNLVDIGRQTYTFRVSSLNSVALSSTGSRFTGSVNNWNHSVGIPPDVRITENDGVEGQGGYLLNIPIDPNGAYECTVTIGCIAYKDLSIPPGSAFGNIAPNISGTYFYVLTDNQSFGSTLSGQPVAEFGGGPFIESAILTQFNLATIEWKNPSDCIGFLVEGWILPLN